MIKDALQHLGLELLAEIGLLIFLLVFAAIVLRTLLTPKKDIEHAASLPNDEPSPPLESHG